ncbi:hypothetical protein EDD11_003169 [Mortierella claussenii]|nr:hypothetical protein EDD11_003169 [Mortierella claussenii]
MKYPMEPASALTPIVAGAIYNQMTGILIHGPIMGEEWIESLKLDKSGDSWMTKDHARDMRSCSWKEFILNFARDA